MFIEYKLTGIAAPAAWPLASVTLTIAGVPPVYTYNYTTTSLFGFTLPDDLNGAISVQIVTIAGTAQTLVLEVCNRDPTTTQASPAGTFTTGLTVGQDIGLQALFTDVAADGLWVPVQTTNVNTNLVAATMTAAGLYVAQSLAYRNIRVRQTVGDGTSVSQVILGFGILV